MAQARRDAEFTDFVAARRTHLRRIAYAICGDWHQADDLLQIALTRLYRAWPRVRRDGREEAYARRIIVRANVDDRRRPWRRHEQAGLDGHETSVRDGLTVEDRSALVEALQELPVMQRKTVLLRHWLGLSVEETAAELGIAAGTVKSHTSRALHALQSTLAHHDT
jgi:RNA polymerase sigma-70 factor (sigma-E family)